jgi:hypothetical protein
MEENTGLESHLASMHRIHGCLVDDWDYWMTDRFAVDGVLRSLPPSYKDHVLDYVNKDKLFTFHVFLAELRTLKVEPIAGEVIDRECIYDTCYKCFSVQTLIAVTMYLILVMLYENKTCCLRDCWEEMRCVLMASKMVDD